jgi:hypothetical protein
MYRLHKHPAQQVHLRLERAVAQPVSPRRPSAQAPNFVHVNGNAAAPETRVRLLVRQYSSQLDALGEQSRKAH